MNPLNLFKIRANYKSLFILIKGRMMNIIQPNTIPPIISTYHCVAAENMVDNNSELKRWAKRKAVELLRFGLIT